MTQQEKQIKIAEVRGWKRLDDGRKGWRLPDGTICSDEAMLVFCPDYFNDLNACFEMRKHLNHEQQSRFCDVLWEVIGAGEHSTFFSRHDTEWILINSTPEQQSEAFGKTLNLW
jgi:hypothetical protein